MTNRVAWVLNDPNSNMLSIDLTEFSDADKQEYISTLSAIFNSVKEQIKDIGLGSNYRSFIANNVKEEE